MTAQEMEFEVYYVVSTQGWNPETGEMDATGAIGGPYATLLGADERLNQARAWDLDTYRIVAVKVKGTVVW